MRKLLPIIRLLRYQVQNERLRHGHVSVPVPVLHRACDWISGGEMLQRPADGCCARLPSRVCPGPRSLLRS